MKIFLGLITAILLMTNLATSHAQELQSGDKEFVHTVFFWLKDPESKTDRAKFERSLKTFINSSQFIQKKHLGIPAGTNREVIDRSYTYCLSLTFRSKADQDKYQTEDVHLAFIKESEDLWKKVIVYDSESIL